MMHACNVIHNVLVLAWIALLKLYRPKVLSKWHV